MGLKRNATPRGVVMRVDHEDSGSSLQVVGGDSSAPSAWGKAL